ncbi:MAG: hypothetical protein HY069_05185 [Chlamydiia bacterium]|nr:hypothetical protein [Chlamydiia bacterium]
MMWHSIEKAFNRAVFYSFSKKKIALTFPVLVLCGVFFVFCKALAHDSGDWISLSMLFLPILLSSGVLLALGVLLVRLYIHESRQLSLGLKRLIGGSLDLMLGTSYLSIPPILVYLCLWIVMGIFFLLQEIPGIGPFFSVVFSFAPFLLIFAALLLCFINLGLLFFVAPAAALHPLKRVSLVKRVFHNFSKKLFSSLILFCIALIPIAIVGGLLYFAAELTHLRFLVAEQSLGVALEWFFIMLPFAAFLSPATIFFFQFAAESYQLLQE